MSGMDNGTGIPLDFCSGTQNLGLGTWVRTVSLGTLRTGTNIAWTVPGQKSLGQPNPKLWKSSPMGWDKKRCDSPGILSSGTQVPGKKSFGVAVPSHAHPCSKGT